MTLWFRRTYVTRTFSVDVTYERKLIGKFALLFYVFFHGIEMKIKSQENTGTI